MLSAFLAALTSASVTLTERSAAATFETTYGRRHCHQVTLFTKDFGMEIQQNPHSKKGPLSHTKTPPIFHTLNTNLSGVRSVTFNRCTYQTRV